MRRGNIGRADLLQALVASQREAASEQRPHADNQIADLFGYVRPEASPPRPRSRPAPLIPDAAEPPEPAPAPPPLEARPLLPTPFWRAERFVPRVAGNSVQVPSVRPVWRNKPRQPPVFHVLAPWRELGVALRTLIGGEWPGTKIDTGAVVEALSRGRQLDRLPMEKRRRWGVHLQVVVDRSDRLVPFWQDQDLVCEALRRLVTSYHLELAVIHETLDEPRIFDTKTGSSSPYRRPPPGGVVLVLGDLGSLDGSGESRRKWRVFGHRLASSGCRAAALVPCPPARCPGDLLRFWQVLPWERQSPAGAQDEASLRRRAERLLRLVSPAVRIEPGFLRAVRRTLGPQEADAGTEADVWEHPALSSRSSVAATLHPDAAKELRAEFDKKEPEEIQRTVLALLRGWRHGLADEIWFEEILNLTPASRNLLPGEDIEDSRRFFSFTGTHPDALPGGAWAVKEWLRRVEPRTTEAGWSVPELAQAICDARKGDPRFAPPAGLDPIHLSETKPEQAVRLWQRGSHLHRGSAAVSAGSLLGIVSSSNDPIQVEALGAAETFWASGRAPSWASDWGEDEYGPWASFSVQGRSGAPVIQRMRWILPGRFWMGAPDKEPRRRGEEERYEGPQHEVTLSTGYWLFDTPCTQALWEAVTGDNPSEFKSPTRPVESVSFVDVQNFLSRINAEVPGLDLVLPSEAQWEYACRAGTRTATYAGEMQILGQNNAPVLDSIAWYGGNSGVGFELGNGHDSSSWLEKQHMHLRAGTRPVGIKAPNPWGLYDTLGNVWEWCADHWHSSYAGAPADGSPWEDAADRVVRGGSWGDDARYLRASCRSRNSTADRGGVIGFRCARVQAMSAVDGSEAAPATPALGGRQTEERRPSQGGPQTAGQLGEAGWNLPRVRHIVVRTNLDELHLERVTKPGWASAMGRDRFGLYADVSVPSKSGKDVVTERLRWIPPGRFWMGSPPDEEGRHDDEGPRHEVMIRYGYWLFDTPCTQALWEAVMGNNPSRFGSPTRPVECVSFDDVQGFLSRINAEVPGLDLVLPSEAQWEYACRAGTRTATYAGEMHHLDWSKAPLLDAIAWYIGNGADGFERTGTRPVAMRAPNAWGLYDMLGNVWEWCADHWHDRYDGAPADGSAWIDSGEGAGDRVVRGASWNDYAGFVRAAYRHGDGPAYLHANLGFRCARVQAVSPISNSVEQPGPSKPVPRNPSTAVTRLQNAVSRILPSSKRKK